MAGDSLGRIFRLTTFGESHSAGLGGVLEGCPAGLKIDELFIKSELNRRRPGQSKIVSQRKEEDKVTFYAGIFEGKSTGSPIGFIIENENAKSQDYAHLKDTFRPSHADFTWEKKYGFRDYRGGGRASARETVARVVGGSIAKLFLKHYKINICAFVTQIHQEILNIPREKINFSEIEKNIVRCPDKSTAERMIKIIENARKNGDSVGGVITCIIQNVPAGLGEPVFDKFHAQLGKAILSIPAVKGFEYGSGFQSVFSKGSELNDIFIKKNNKIGTATNHSGGIQGGITNGEEIYFSAAFKPVATIMKDQQSVDRRGNIITLKGKGRHDPCVLPRAVPIVEAMAALVLADFLLVNRAARL